MEEAKRVVETYSRDQRVHYLQTNRSFVPTKDVNRGISDTCRNSVPLCVCTRFNLFLWCLSFYLFIN